MSEHASEENAVNANKPGLVARLLAVPRAAVAWATSSMLRVAILGLGAVAAVTGAVVIWLVTHSATQEQPRIALETVLESLDREAFPQAKAFAEAMLADARLTADERGGPAFVLGAVSAYEADEMGPKTRAARYLIAARYLEEANQRGFPAGREAEGLYLLGRSLFYSDQVVAARTALSDALPLNRDKAAELHRMLAEAYLRDSHPRLDEAMKHNAALLATEGLPAGERIEASIQRADILFRQGKSAECSAVLAELPTAARELADVILIRGQLLMREAAALGQQSHDAAARNEASEKYHAAIKLLRLADSRDTLGGSAASEAMYLLGLCFMELDDARAAMQQFERARRLHPDTQEALAAGFHEGELYREMGQDDEAMAAYHRLLEGVKSPNEYANRWLPLEEVRTRMLAVFDAYRTEAKFEVCVELAQILPTLLGRAKALELEGEADSAWGRRLLADAEALPESQAAPVRQAALARFRAAGSVYDRLARDQIATRQYTDHLWSSANAFFQGQDFASAARMMRDYLRNETRRRHPQALVLLAESLLALGRVNEAIASLQECIEFYPRDAATYRARYLASKASLELGNVKQAESLLRDNLGGEFLSPASREWRDSLFALGALLHAERRFDEAVTRLDEALQRYPDAAQSLETRYMLADAYRQQAQSAADKLKQDLPATSQLVHSKEIHDTLLRALDQYKQVQTTLTRQQENGPLRPTERAILRNTTFAVGSVLSDLGQLDGAIKAFFTAANRYQHSPEALDAYVQIAGAYRRLDKPVEARRALEQAKVVLARLKPEDDPMHTTNFDRKQWAEVLDALSQL
jgi:TolA-binding protein